MTIVPGMTLRFSYDKVLYSTAMLDHDGRASTLVMQTTSMLVVSCAALQTDGARACLVVTSDGMQGWIRCTCWDETNTPEGGR